MMVEYICSHVNGLRQSNEDEEDVEFAEFPASTEDEVQLLNEKLKDKQFYKKVVSIKKQSNWKVKNEYEKNYVNKKALIKKKYSNFKKFDFKNSCLNYEKIRN